MKPFRSLGRWIRDLKLVGKLLIPLLFMVVLMGVVGTFATVRFLSARAQQDVDALVLTRSVDTDAYLRDSALGLLESVRFASNIQGVPAAVQTRDTATARRLLASVLAVRTDLDFLIATDARGVGIVEISRKGKTITVSSGHRWGGNGFVSAVLRGRADQNSDKHSGIMPLTGTQALATAGPIRGDTLVGAMIVGSDMQEVIDGAAKRVRAGVSLFDSDRKLIASSGGSQTGPPASANTRTVRIVQHIGTTRVATLYSSFLVQGERMGTLAISIPTQPVFAAVQGARLRLLLLMLLAMVSVVGIGLGLSRYILRQVRPLVETNRALGRGDLTARAPVFGTDELGEVAQGLNQMAEELQASYGDLEMRVEARTEELQRMYTEVVRTGEVRSEFFAAISHEFRTPLFAIIGHAEMMLDPDFKPKGGNWRKEFAETIKGSGEDLLARVDEILDLAKFETGRMEIQLQELDVADSIKALRGTIEALARRSALKAKIEVTTGLPKVKADPVRLRQMVMNLASNAVKYTPAGGAVGLSVAARNGHVEISVHDTGVGIPKRSAEHIFEPFYQVSGTRAQKGQSSTGLGLALTKRLVEAHGGRIWFTSAPGQGTTFTFSLQSADGPAGKKMRRTAN